MSTEPPDIKNWFAIYAYESPVLDTNDELRLSNYQESKITRAGLHIGIKRREWHKNYSTQNNDASVGKKMVSAGLVRTNSSVEHNRQDHKYWKFKSTYPFGIKYKFHLEDAVDRP